MNSTNEKAAFKIQKAVDSNFCHLAKDSISSLWDSADDLSVGRGQKLYEDKLMSNYNSPFVVRQYQTSPQRNSTTWQVGGK